MIQNYDHCLRFQVVDKRISYIDDGAPEVVADNHGNICIHIEFDEQWDGVGKVARFVFNGRWVDIVLDADGDCFCPPEVVKKGRFSLGVYGAELKTSTPIVVTVLQSILSDSGEELPEDPTPGVYDQILNQYAVAVEAADAATQAAWNAAEEVAAAINALNDAKRELEEGGVISSLKEHNKGYNFKIWLGTEAEYEEIKDKIGDNVLCLTTDGTSKDDLIELMCNYDEELRAHFENTLETEIKAKVTDYGLGLAVTKKWSEVDELWSPGWYKFADNGASAGGITFDHAYMRVDSYNHTHVIQTLYVIKGNNRVVLVRSKFASVWEDEWSWVNPLMEANTEYRTTELWHSKPVYTKLFEFAAAKQVVKELGLNDYEGKGRIIRHSAYTSTTALPTLHFASDAAPPMYVKILPSIGTIQYIDETGTASSNGTVYVQVWYTKS